MLLLHLSDIHFRNSEINTSQDPHHYLRNELLRDAKNQCRMLGAPDAIIISGDIAFSAQPEEYDFATKWIEELCEACGSKMKDVVVVPGNHDVDRVDAGGTLVQMIHDTIKKSPTPSNVIRQHMQDPQTRNLLYKSLENYNEFASQFFCNLLPPDRTRVKKDLLLNDRSALRVWGLNSVFVSSSKDKKGDLFLDSASLQITNEDGVVNLVVAHHPLFWLRDSQTFDDHFNGVAPLQMFGHAHTNRVSNNAEYSRWIASAANPDMQELGYEPGYNLIELEVAGGPTNRQLKIKSHERVWQTAPNGFRPKTHKGGVPFSTNTIDLEEWYPPENLGSVIHSACPIDDVSLVEEMQLGIGGEMITTREIGLMFYKLPFSKKMAIAGRLELLEEDDMHLPDHERFRLVVIRAAAGNKLEELADAVRNAK
tara:strand:- start:8043 stop:9314 length:1272 start_codon:yes stop_codon:yes gene_type:complete